MTNWQDPAIQLADAFALIKLTYLVAGVYIWEFLLNLNFDYSVITRKRKFVRTQLIFIGCRWCTLFAIIPNLVGLDTTQGIDCRATVIMNYIFGYLSILFASSLIILRIYALWEKHRMVTAVASGCWLANAISYTYSVATFVGQRIGMFCEEDNTLHNRISIFCTFTTDLILLALMLAGVLRWKGEGESGYLWWLLYTQGLAWVVVFALAEVPPVVFIILDLNYPMNRMSLFPAVIILSVGASRFYLGLINRSPFNNGLVEAVDVQSWVAETQVRVPDPSITPELLRRQHTGDLFASNSLMGGSLGGSVA
ncbi:hypothetical protein BJV74DRAFT_166007 [Russula compacta]|nr:hypothetical protein BJV74DRAFT_166007 [Russula compacta]